MEKKKYYLGLDIGTDSVGYAVTDQEYNVLKLHGEPAWGVHLFEAANTKAKRRAFRTGRRRLDRRQQRVQLVQELFAKEIAKKDERFLQRLQESALYASDKAERFSLFNDKGYTDREYHRDYPTIHHLIVDLMNNDKAFDVRLVYLACAWLVAHRGHFLNEIDKENVSKITDFSIVYDELRNYLISNENTIPWDGCDVSAIADVLKTKTGLTKKNKALFAVCFANGKPPKIQKEGFAYNCEELLKALCGSMVSAAKLFFNEEYSEIPSFTLGSDDETLAEVMGMLGDDAQLIEKLKAIYDWSLLVDILGSAESISAAKVAVYKQHEKDLKTLKYFVRKYKPESFSEVFREQRKKEKDNYTAYTFHGDVSEIKRKVSQAGFCKFLKGIVGSINPEEADIAQYEDMMERIVLENFLPKQKNTDNRVIPYQLYWYELDTILKKAEAYLPFLAQKDEEGLSVSDKLRSIFVFRVPYFVGPLNSSSPYAWIKRKAGKIYPWNFMDMVDLDASEDEFINRLVGNCTYLPSEKALPKDSLLYHKFMVLNEINNIKINGQPITVDAKQHIYTQVFMKYRKVTVKRIREYLLSNGYMSKEDTLSGIDVSIKSDLKPQHDFRRLMESGQLTEEQVEDIIRRSSYCEDRHRFKRWIEKNYSFLSEDDRAYVSRLSYKDFGRLSRRFLTEITAVADYSTGEIMSIITAMWETNMNLMELLSDKFDYAVTVQDEQEAYYVENVKDIDSRMDELYLSNSVRRPILRTFEIIDEVTKVFGTPEKVFIEMARGGTPDLKGRRTQSRKAQLLELYEKCDTEDVRILREQIDAMGDAADSKLQSEKLFLYYTQLGRCMYTGKVIDLETLMRGDTSAFNIDHIYPRALVKDDSILNNKVLVDSSENGAKLDNPISSQIHDRMFTFWKSERRIIIDNDMCEIS